MFSIKPDHFIVWSKLDIHVNKIMNQIARFILPLTLFPGIIHFIFTGLWSFSHSAPWYIYGYGCVVICDWSIVHRYWVIVQSSELYFTLQDGASTEVKFFFRQSSRDHLENMVIVAFCNEILICSWNNIVNDISIVHLIVSYVIISVESIKYGSFSVRVKSWTSPTVSLLCPV